MPEAGPALCTMLAVTPRAEKSAGFFACTTDLDDDRVAGHAAVLWDTDGSVAYPDCFPGTPVQRGTGLLHTEYRSMVAVTVAKLPARLPASADIAEAIGLYAGTLPGVPSYCYPSSGIRSAQRRLADMCRYGKPDARPYKRLDADYDAGDVRCSDGLFHVARWHGSQMAMSFTTPDGAASRVRLAALLASGCCLLGLSRGDGAASMSLLCLDAGRDVYREACTAAFTAVQSAAASRTCALFAAPEDMFPESAQPPGPDAQEPLLQDSVFRLLTLNGGGGIEMPWRQSPGGAACGRMLAAHRESGVPVDEIIGICRKEDL